MLLSSCIPIIGMEPHQYSPTAQSRSTSDLELSELHLEASPESLAAPAQAIPPIPTRNRCSWRTIVPVSIAGLGLAVCGYAIYIIVSEISKPSYFKSQSLLPQPQVLNSYDTQLQYYVGDIAMPTASLDANRNGPHVYTQPLVLQTLPTDLRSNEKKIHRLLSKKALSDSNQIYTKNNCSTHNHKGDKAVQTEQTKKIPKKYLKKR